jgi:hypothetical protein
MIRICLVGAAALDTNHAPNMHMAIEHLWLLPFRQAVDRIAPTRALEQLLFKVRRSGGCPENALHQNLQRCAPTGHRLNDLHAIWVILRSIS